MSMGTPFPRAAGVAPAQRSAEGMLPVAAGASPGGRRRLHSEQLFGPAQEIEIAHGDAVYRLRRTSLGKLILTK